MDKISTRCSWLIAMLMMLSLTAHAQKMRVGPPAYTPRYVWKPYSDKELAKNIVELKFDSVKVLAFGCAPYLNPQPTDRLYRESDVGFILASGLVDSTQHWLPLLIDTGKVLAMADLKAILKTITHYDVLVNPPKGKPLRIDQPVGCFEPHIGIVFYNRGLVNAHIDICLTCDQLNFEIFDSGRIKYKTNISILGKNRRTLYRQILNKYHIKDCSME